VIVVGLLPNKPPPVLVPKPPKPAGAVEVPPKGPVVPGACNTDIFARQNFSKKRTDGWALKLNAPVGAAGCPNAVEVPKRLV
jgi:hypothetical protein